MTYYITALTNDRARLIVSETRTTDSDVADLTEAAYRAKGLAVTRWQEA